MQDRCIERFPCLHGSDDKIHAFITVLKTVWLAPRRTVAEPYPQRKNDTLEVQVAECREDELFEVRLLCLLAMFQQLISNDVPLCCKSDVLLAFRQAVDG
ncbi:hypothetical protein POTOM_049673 [Populus tomentosa]|uniref:Uncharacterized protein n=1 Tax=Populus tomentosa TaxID=118781 RepID=A0A8X8CAP5_POPTO|nr:hypothetical protein POTOM_049673 [Populus tomentosa]